MKARPFWLFMLSLAALSPPAEALLGLGEKSVSWREEVALRTGQALLVERSVTFGPDEWFRAGRGPMKKQTLSFVHSGRTVRWESAGGYPETPAVLEILDGAPVLVTPIAGWFRCHRYDFPRDGLVAWRQEGGKWVRIDAARVPADVVANLLRDFGRLMSDPPAKGLVVNAAWKERIGAPDKHGHTVAVLSRQSTEGEQACAKLRPGPDPVLAASAQRVTLAEKAARTVIADRGALSTAPEAVSAAGVRASLGQWMQAAWVSEDCGKVVKRVEPRYRYEGDATSMRGILSGYTIHIAALEGDAMIALEGSQPGLAGIACDDRMVLVTRRASADRLLVARFDRAGVPIDATWVQLPGAAEISVDPKAWPALWRVNISGDLEVQMVLADYAYPLSMSQGGTLRRKATYTVKLPPLQ